MGLRRVNTAQDTSQGFGPQLFAFSAITLRNSLYGCGALCKFCESAQRVKASKKKNLQNELPPHFVRRISSACMAW